MNVENLSARAARLREEFDRSFALPAAGADARTEDFLGIGLAGDPHALRLAEIAHVGPLSEITPLPSARPGFLGLAGLRGAIFPVYDLRVLLGYPAADAPRWMAIAAGQGLALAFDSVEAYLRVPLGSATPGADLPSRRHVREVLRLDDQVRPIVSISSLLASVQSASGSSVT
jgi:chemotaxis signal transduction protein